MNVIESFKSESKRIKGFLYSFLVIIDIKIVDIIAIVNIIIIVNITKAVFCNEIFVIINDPLPLLILI